MPDLKEILAPLGAYADEDEEKQQEAANELHKLYPAIADVLINRGGKGNREAADAKKKQKAAEKDLTEAKEQIEALEKKLEGAESRSPEEVQRLQKQILKLEGQVKEKDDLLVTEKQRSVEARRSADLAVFRKHTKPGQAGGVQERYDEDLALKYAHLISYAEDGTREVHKIDDPDAVYTPAKGQDPLELLAADAVKKAPAWARLTGVEGGGGQGGGGRGGEGEVSTDKIVDEKLQGNTYRGAF